MRCLPQDTTTTSGSEKSPEASASERATPAYEKPCLEFVGSLSNLLGKSGGIPDYTHRKPNSGRP
jgi:hypothetical protein